MDESKKIFDSFQKPFDTNEFNPITNNVYNLCVFLCLWQLRHWLSIMLMSSALLFVCAVYCANKSLATHSNSINSAPLCVCVAYFVLMREKSHCLTITIC